MKIGFVTVMHVSEKFRPDGEQYIKDYLYTLWSNSIFPYKVYIIDNGSDKQYNYDMWYKKYPNEIDYTYIPDQSIGGITGAWNLGIYKAYLDGCRIINMTNDDILFNKTINPYFEFITNHELMDISLYGPVSNGILGGIQKQPKPINKIIEFNSELLNGFFFTFTDNFYKTHRREKDKLFATKHEHSGGDGKWGGQEGEFYRFKNEGTRFFVIGHTWIHHYKIMGYRATRDADKRGEL